MPVVKKLTRIGNSRGVILPQPILDQLNWGEDAEVEIRIKGDALIIEPHRYATGEEFSSRADKVLRKRRKLYERLVK